MINSLPRLARPLAAAFLLVAAAGCDQQSKEAGVGVKQAWVRLPAVPGRPAAGYFRATSSEAGDEIIGVTSSAANVEMHETVSEGTKSAMRPIATAAFASDKTIRFEPGGKHLMLFGLDPKLQPGGKIPLSFRFKSSPPVAVEAELKALGEEPSEHEGH